MAVFDDCRAGMTISRYGGASPGFPYMGPLPGGGYEGSTQELDDLVKDASVALVAEYGRDVRIRFNSDRRSGGAWIADGGIGFNAFCTIGICAGYQKILPKGTNILYWVSDRERDAEFAALPETLKMHLYVKESALRDPSLATNRSVARPYMYMEIESVSAAIDWLRQNAIAPDISA